MTIESTSVKMVIVSVLLLVVMISTAHGRGRINGVDANSKFLIYYGNDFSQRNLDIMKSFDVVVLHPDRSNCTPRVVQELQDGGVDYVLGYISIGEDSPGPGEAAIIHDSAGPVYIDETTQNKVFQHSGVASFYVDSVYHASTSSYAHDTEADTNGTFGGYFILPTSSWRWVLNVMRIGGNPGIFTARQYSAGLQQMAGQRGADIDSRTENFGFDGFFLDTIDTAGPYTDEGWYPWAAEEMKNTVKFISDTYTDKVILANRGIFYYQPGLYNARYNVRPIEHSIRPYVNAVLFESYMLDSDASHTGISPYYQDNKYNNAPKLMAEANRSDGFTVSSIDYMMYRGNSYYDELFEESVRENGWMQYLSLDRPIDTVELYIANKLPTLDTTAPEWTNTSAGYNQVASPRVGVQRLTRANPGEIIVSWDAAKDQTWPVKYNIYVATQSDFSDQVKHAAVAFAKGTGWELDPSSNFPNQFTLQGLAAGTYHIRVRAEDSSPANLEEENTVTLSITLSDNVLTNPVAPGAIVLDGNISDWSTLTSFGGGDPDDIQNGLSFVDPEDGANRAPVDWINVWMAHDTSNLYIAYQNDENISINWRYLVYLDTDSSTTTGFVGPSAGYPVGADYMIQGYWLWHYTGNGTEWSWEPIGPLGRIWNGAYGEMYMPRSWIGSPSSINLFFHGNNDSFGTASDYYPDNAMSEGGSFSYTMH
jgi:hypothetical protein